MSSQALRKAIRFLIDEIEMSERRAFAAETFVETQTEAAATRTPPDVVRLQEMLDESTSAIAVLERGKELDASAIASLQKRCGEMGQKIAELEKQLAAKEESFAAKANLTHVGFAIRNDKLTSVVNLASDYLNWPYIIDLNTRRRIYVGAPEPLKGAP